MEIESKVPRKESSFEIIANSDEDDMVTTSLYSSTQSSIFESLNSCYFPQLLVSEATNCDLMEKQTTCSESKGVKLDPNSLVESFENFSNTPDKTINCDKTSTSLWMDEITANEIKPYSMKYQATCTYEKLDATDVEETWWLDDVDGETIWNQPKGTTEKNFKKKNLDNSPQSAKNHILNIDFPVKHIRSNPETDVNLDPETIGNKDKLSAAKRSEDFVRQNFANRLIFPSTCCYLFKHGLRACKSIRNNRTLLNVASELKLSFRKLLHTFELEMNFIAGMNDPLKILITAKASDSLVIEEAFYQSLSGQINISKIPEIKDLNLAVLPVGYNSSLLVAQSKINKARSQHDYENNAIIISTTTFISEIYPQRWQLSTILYLEDPNLNMNLHNFTSTIPIPNDYVLQAQKLTADDYPFKDMGLAVTIGQAIGCITDDVDFEENLCGISHSVNLKSAAVILAGMYSRYVNRYEQ